MATVLSALLLLCLIVLALASWPWTRRRAATGPRTDVTWSS